MAEVTKKRLIEVCEKVSGKRLTPVNGEAAILLFDSERNRIGSIPNRGKLGHSTLPMPVAYDVLKSVTRGDSEKYADAKRLLKT